MRRLMTGYAINFNLRHERRGHLFQNRYKSIVCQEDLYLKKKYPSIDLETLARDIAADQGITEEELRSGSRKRKISPARSAFCRASVGEMGYPAAGVARFLGVTTSAVVRAAQAEELLGRPAAS